MSHIFDALRRSESERTGMELSAATELLQIAEEAAAEPVRITSCEEAVELEAAVAAKPPVTAATIAHDALVGIPTGDAEEDQLYQFQSLHVSVPPQSRVVSLTERESLGAEKFRFLAVRLQQLRQRRPLKKVLITSTVPQEGKSTVAANLASALARRAQQKTLLLEGDLRRASLAQLLGLGKLSGISEWLKGDSDGRTSIYHLEGSGLCILPAGNAVDNPLELMQSARLPPLMEQLTTWFDWIVIDSPPVLPLADTSIWMRLADGILLVTRQGATEKQQLKKGLEVIESSKLLGALLNSSRGVANGDYYKYYSARQSSGAAVAR